LGSASGLLGEKLRPVVNEIVKGGIEMDAHAMVRKVLQTLHDENRLLSASDLGLNDQAYVQLLETMVKGKLITGVTITTGEGGEPELLSTENVELTSMGRTVRSL
jgi:hypothetical protein